jgi:transglycosylase-like protein with SLT domain
MDLVTILTACALGFKAALFVPLGVLDNCSASSGLGATVSPRNGSAKIERWAAYISEAACRFGRPEAWVRAVMQAESRGAADATSPTGAIGLMQIMPETYGELRARYGLGANAYNPHDNIIAATAYMSEMIALSASRTSSPLTMPVPLGSKIICSVGARCQKRRSGIWRKSATCRWGRPRPANCQLPNLSPS